MNVRDRLDKMTNEHNKYVEDLCKAAMMEHNCWDPNRFEIIRELGFPFDHVTVRYKTDEEMQEESMKSASL